MRATLLLVLFLCPFLVKAQSDTTSQKPHEQYCMVLATAKLMSSKVNITVDFGQETKLFSFKDQRLKDEAGKVITLNYMSTQGWIFVNAYAITVSGQNVYHYVMRRPVTNQG
jgi:hypothetical protein